jgi:hypothetical protein
MADKTLPIHMLSKMQARKINKEHFINLLPLYGDIMKMNVHFQGSSNWGKWPCKWHWNKTGRMPFGWKYTVTPYLCKDRSLTIFEKDLQVSLLFTKMQSLEQWWDNGCATHTKCVLLWNMGHQCHITERIVEYNCVFQHRNPLFFAMRGRRFAISICLLFGGIPYHDISLHYVTERQTSQM